MTSITPFLWFDNNVSEAVAFYKSVFPNAEVETVNDFMASFELEGRSSTPSMAVQNTSSTRRSPLHQRREPEEVDYFWNRLIADGGEEFEMRMAQGQIRPVLAGCAHGPRPLLERSRSQKGRSCHAGHDEDAKDHHRRPRQGNCRLMTTRVIE